MKRFIGILFLTVLLAPATVTFIWLKVEKATLKKEIKWQMIKGIADDELVTLSFTKTEADELLRWEHAKEFEYKNQMYDVVKTEQRGDSVFYICWWDNKETQLNKKLSALVSEAFGNNPEPQKKQSNLINFYKILFYQPLASNSLGQTQYFKVQFKRLHNLYCAPVLNTLDPPPPFC